jgi:hypothetical protein
MSTPEARIATPLQAPWQQAMGGGLAARAASSVPRVEHADEGAAAAGRAWWRTGLRVMRDVGIGFALIAAIPLAAIGVLGPAEWITNSTRDRVVEMARVRPLGAPRDAAITPIAAGEALYRLAPPKNESGLVMKPVVADSLPWAGALPADGLFANHRSTWWGGPDATTVIERAAAGYSVDEIAWLKQIADAPIWRDVDLVAKAPAIDVDGARLAVPLDPAKPWLYPPTTATQRLRTIASAGVARAAYYVTQHDYASADAALRSVVSLGFALVDNGTSFLEALTGRVLVDIGRNGMRQLAAIDGRNDVYALAAPFRSNPDARRTPMAVRESNAVRFLADHTLPRSFRFEQYGLVAYSTCTQLSAVITGPSAAAVAAMEDARRTLPRFDSERTMLEVQGHRVDAIVNTVQPDNALTSIVVGAAEVTSAVTGNPRIATCARFATARLQGH